MTLPGARPAARIFAVCAAIVVMFQLALAAGAPLGAYAMGGVHPGQFPPALRAAAVGQAALMVAFAFVMLVRAGVVAPRAQAAARLPAWAVVVFSAIALVLNLATPSEGERLLWAPIAALMLLCSVRVATSP